MTIAGGSQNVIVSANGNFLALGANAEGQCDVNDAMEGVRVLDGRWHDGSGN